MRLFVECIFSVRSVRAGTGVFASSLLSSQLPKLYHRNLQASKSLHIPYQSQGILCLVWKELRKLLFWHFLSSSKYFVFAKANVWNSKAKSWSICSLHSAVSTFCRDNGREVWSIGTCMRRSESEVAQSCPTLLDPVDCSLPGSSIHGIFQARILEWIAISFSRGSSWPRDRTQVPRIGGRRFNLWATREALEEKGTTQILSPPHIRSQHLPQRWHVFPTTSGSYTALPRVPFHD